MDTYRSSDAAVRDKADLTLLMDALNASSSTLRRDDAGLWILRGRAGCFACTWGDGTSWQLIVAPEEIISSKQWIYHKRRLAFCELTQDGDAEGCFRLHRLPTPAEAEAIRDILGIRKAYSPEELERRREVGRQAQGNLRRHGGGFKPGTGVQNDGPVPEPASSAELAKT